MDDTLAMLDQGMQDLAAAAARQTNNTMIIKFSLDPMENEGKSKLANRPVYDDVEMIEIRAPGERDFIHRPVRDGDKMEYAKQYMAWKLNQNQETASGTPLAQWPPIKRSQVEEAKYFGMHTVEQLSEVSDANLQRLGPGWMALRQSARDWLKTAKDGSAVSALRAENDDMRARIDTLEAMLTKQAAELQSGKPQAIVAQAALAPVGLTPEQVQSMIAAAVKTFAPAAAPAPVRRKPGPKSKAEKAALAAGNGEVK